MKHSIIASAIVLTLASNAAVAACSPPGASRVTNTGGNAALTNLLSGNTVCAVRGGDRWQEEHQAGGQLWDYKRGDGHPVDPRKQIGTWAVTGQGANTVVTYTYDGGPSYTFGVWDDQDGTYSFCEAGVLNVDNATVVSGVNVGCP